MTLPPEILVYGREGCHLCDQLCEELAAVTRGRVRITVVDVDSSAELARRYGERVPVVCWAGEEICQYRLDAPATRRLEQLLGRGGRD